MPFAEPGSAASGEWLKVRIEVADQELPEAWRLAYERDRTSEVTSADPSPERRAARALAAFILTGLAFLALPGTFLGVWNLMVISEHRAATAASTAWIQAHGHAQLFGWVGSFILGISLYVLPKFQGRGLKKFGMVWMIWGPGPRASPMPAMKPGPFAQRHLEGFQPTLHCSAPFTNTLPGAWAATVRALEEEEDCAYILQQIAACRGAINGLMTELIEGEVRHHVLSPTAKPGSNRTLAAERLIKILHTYLK